MRKLRALKALWLALRQRAYLGDRTVPDDVDAFLVAVCEHSPEVLNAAREQLESGVKEWHQIPILNKLEARRA